MSPWNIFIGRNTEDKKIYIVDFKYSLKLFDKGNLASNDILGDRLTEVADEKDNNEFSSLNRCLNLIRSKKDDVESLLYVLLFMYNGGRLLDRKLDLSNKQKTVTEINK